MKYNYCENCFNPSKSDEVCGVCKYNPKNVYVKDYFIDYPMYCKFGYADCISDPGYIWKHYRDWYIELYGDVDPSTVECKYCEDGSRYDDEDK